MAPRTDHNAAQPALEVGSAAALAMELFPAHPEEQWFPAAISVREGIPAQQDWKTFFQTLCHHSSVLEMQRWMTAERAKTGIT